jgi:aspartyl-tRNA(Asn)/glutamyl-tRNA(Gln) amidotransferase subunit B
MPGEIKKVRSMEYVADIGLEVHVQLKTRTKMFCGCAAESGGAPNARICPVCLGYPGALPTMNREAIRLCVRAGLILGCEISRFSKFDRKNYFYPDMPKNYQISQYDKPLCVGGGVEIPVGEGGARAVRLTRIHQEEDVAKNTHEGGASLVDFNRAGTPLMEIVTEPDLHSADEAMAFLQALKEMLQYGDISECNLEEGNMRCDVNCSVRPNGSTSLGVKTEIKNMNTFRGVHAALSHEIARQIDTLRGGGTIVQETRRWDPDREITESMRTKEDAHDYRYFPEPDLMPVALTEAEIESWRADLPEMPTARRARYAKDFGLPAYDAGVLAAERDVADWFEAAAAHADNVKAVSNWVMTDVRRELSARGLTLDRIGLQPEDLAALIRMVDAGTININAAREVFAELFERGGDPARMVREKGLAQVSDAGALEDLAAKAIDDNPKSVEDFRGGKEAALQYLMGQVMRMSRGKANPQAVREILRRRLTE